MEPRKVQKVGYSTLSVSLPMAWTKKVGIQKGDLVFISEETDGALRLTTEPGKTANNIEYVVDVDRCDNTKLLARVIVGNYVLGRSLIRVQSNRRLMREQIESIREVTHRLLGIGIIEESDLHLLLQCLQVATELIWNGQQCPVEGFSEAKTFPSGSLQVL